MPALLHPDDVAQRLGVNPRTVRRMIRSGELPRVNIGSDARPRYRVSDTALAAWIAARTSTASTTT